MDFCRQRGLEPSGPPGRDRKKRRPPIGDSRRSITHRESAFCLAASPRCSGYEAVWSALQTRESSRCNEGIASRRWLLASLNLVQLIASPPTWRSGNLLRASFRSLNHYIDSQLENLPGQPQKKRRRAKEVNCDKLFQGKELRGTAGCQVRQTGPNVAAMVKLNVAASTRSFYIATAP